jgi:Kef-type K+ transport system membrane component KefB
VHFSLSDPFGLFLLQLLIILMATRLAGWLVSKWGQPAVVGEILAGIVLGPSLLGRFAPEIEKSLFPPTSFGSLSLVSEMGLILFMFVIGIELDAAVMRKKAKQSIAISIASIIIPFIGGYLLALKIYSLYAPQGTAFSGFAIFMGIAMSVTAFPVLGRILRERNLERTPTGILALSAAAADDVVAWGMLALVTALLKTGNLHDAGITIFYWSLFIAFLIFIIRPLLRKLIMRKDQEGGMPRSLIPILLGGMLASAWSTQMLGMHALFGAFLFGLIIPVDWIYSKAFIARIGDIATVLLIPVFFVMTGLRTRIDVMNGVQDWIYCLIVIAIAVVGKWGGAALAARLTGSDKRESMALGAMMNTRGLMQLVVLNIGYDLGVLSPALFSMMVIMALVTTAMTGPALKRLGS